ncbi:MAG TPA: zinc dependent phospholipase C family protein, partial [bacterium]|nr:zinc dependent phospholipase C family protein [bacterium]
FLYGNLAADTVLAKNLADQDQHVHNWEVAVRLFDLTHDDADKAFVYGYLSHLAADTVAHNYFVPKKRVDSFRTITTGHAYWELRYDSFLPEQVWGAAKDIGKQRFPQQDELLIGGLKPTILTVDTNRRIWGGIVSLSANVDRWREFMRSHAEKSQTSFHSDERDVLRGLAVETVSGFLNEFRDSRAFRADPTGIGNLDAAWKIGGLLRKNTSKGLMDPREADQIARQVGDRLREGLHVERSVDLSDELRASGA